jgi:hypothetical protein
MSHIFLGLSNLATLSFQMRHFCKEFVYITQGFQFEWIVSTLRQHPRRVFGSKKEEAVGVGDI